MEATTILSIRKNKSVVMIGDGQVTLGNTVMKSNARKVKKTYHDKVLAGFAGATADAFTLFERFEGKLEECSGNLTKASVDMAKEWRSDKMLRRLEAMLCVADKEYSFILSGTGDVIEPEDGVMAIGSGSMFAISAAKALMDNTKLTAKEIALMPPSYLLSIAPMVGYTNSYYRLITKKTLLFTEMTTSGSILRACIKKNITACICTMANKFF